MKIILLLGCWGRTENGFTICKGISNKILDITKKEKTNIEIADFLDSSYHLFDRPLYNNVHTALFKIQENFSTKIRPLFDKKLYQLMEEFCIAHRKCGLYLRLDMENESE